MKTPLQQKLTRIAPSVAIETVWEHDLDERWNDPTNADWTRGENRDDWQAWQSEVRAAAIHQGRILDGHAYLGGTWEKFGDNPAESNPNISGYENQMTQEALKDLAAQLPEKQDLQYQIARAIKECELEANKETITP